MKNLYTCFVLLLILSFASDDVLAQGRISQYKGRRTAFAQNKRYYSVGFSVNALNYFGDLASKNQIASTEISFTRPGFGATGMARLGPLFSVRGSFMWGRVKGDDFKSSPTDIDSRPRYARNLHFRNDIKELSLDLVFDLKSHYRTFMTRPEWVPYLFVGVGVFHHNPKAKVPEFDFVHYPIGQEAPIQENDPLYGEVSPGDWVELKPLGTEGQYIDGVGVDGTYSNWQIAVPFGVGIRYRVSRYIDLSFEFGYRQTFTDYLDDVSADYINMDDFGTGPQANLARVMADRSLEKTAAVSGDPRQVEYLLGVIGTQSYGAVPPGFPAGPYELLGSYGNSHFNRGKGDTDVYLVSSFKLTYIIGTSVRNAKFR